jgi:hypothetical protein
LGVGSAGSSKNFTSSVLRRLFTTAFASTSAVDRMGATMMGAGMPSMVAVVSVSAGAGVVTVSSEAVLGTSLPTTRKLDPAASKVGVEMVAVIVVAEVVVAVVDLFGPSLLAECSWSAKIVCIESRASGDRLDSLIILKSGAARRGMGARAPTPGLSTLPDDPRFSELHETLFDVLRVTSSHEPALSTLMRESSADSAVVVGRVMGVVV